MTIPEAHAEVRKAWSAAYSAEAIAKAVDSISPKALGYRINILITRLCFRGIYFPQMTRWEWTKVITQYRHTIFKVGAQAFAAWRKARHDRRTATVAIEAPMP